MSFRKIYLLVLITVSMPIIFHYSLKPAQMETSDSFYKAIEDLPQDSGKLVLIAMDWGPQGKAENEPQTAVAIEHLMRRRIPFGLISIYQYAPPFMKSIPEEIAKKLHAETPSETWSYGKDWVNFGYRINGGLMIQGLAKNSDIAEYLKADANGTPLKEVQCMKNVHTIKDIAMLIQFTSLVGTFSSWIQFFQAQGYRPPVLHGCTSITIPEAYTYLASGQILGLHEGVAGAAWYDYLLSKNYPKRKPSVAIRNNTSVAVAQILVVLLIILGNINYFLRRKKIDQARN